MKKNSISTLAALAVIAVSSCAPLGKYRNEASVPDNLYAAAPDSANMASLGWRDVFTDPCLQALIDSALLHNLDLQMAYEHVQQAEAVLKGARLSYLPFLSLNPGVGAAFSSSGNPAYAYNIGTDFSWQADIFGKTANRVKLAQASAIQAEDYRQAVRVSLIASVANTYYALLMLDESLATALEMESVWKNSVEAIRTMKSVGYATQVGVNQYESTYANIRIKAIEIQTQIEQTENAMSLLLGTVPSTVRRGRLREQRLPETLDAGVPAQLLSCRPDVRAAGRELEVAFYTTKAAWLNFFPDLNIGFSGSLGNAFGVSAPISLLGNLTAGLAAPVLRGGQNKAALLDAQSRQREAGMNFDKTVLNAGVEVSDSFREYRSCTRKLELYGEQVDALTTARNDTERMMINGQGATYLDVLTAHNALISAKFEMIGNYARRMQAVVKFYAALGGGSEY